jgi:hypothetical protein
MEKKNPREEEKIGTEEAFRSLGRFYEEGQARVFERDQIVD